MPFFETNDHTSLYYRDWGTGAPVVFVNSIVLSGAMWEYQMLYLCDQGCAVLPMTAEVMAARTIRGEAMI